MAPRILAARISANQSHQQFDLACCNLPRMVITYTASQTSIGQTCFSNICATLPSKAEPSKVISEANHKMLCLWLGQPKICGMSTPHTRKSNPISSLPSVQSRGLVEASVKRMVYRCVGYLHGCLAGSAPKPTYIFGTKPSKLNPHFLIRTGNCFINSHNEAF